MVKRSPAQLDFDFAKHGWAFCNRDMLEGKVERLKEIATKLHPLDERHGILEVIEQKLEGMKDGQAKETC